MATPPVPERTSLVLEDLGPDTASMDLPLTANYDCVHANHYILDLACDFTQKTFYGILLLELDYSGKKKSSEKIVLDSCDIDILAVHQLRTVGNVCDHSCSDPLRCIQCLDKPFSSDLPSACDRPESDDKLDDPFEDRARDFPTHLSPANAELLCGRPATNQIPDCSNKRKQSPAETSNRFEVEGSLEFRLSDWSLTIHTGSKRVSWLRITYMTRPNTRSLHWRRDMCGNPCVYTAAAGINNRGLFPSQDLPQAMATWELTVRLPIASESLVFTTGDDKGRISLSETEKRFHFVSSLVAPLSTFAIGVGSWSVEELASRADQLQLPLRLIGPSPLTGSKATLLRSYLPAAVQVAASILGPYPLPRLDVVILPRSFSGLGLASPNLTFISPSLLAGDPALLVKVSHEICHAWFGILVGCEDWTEAWLSEGFATFLEDFVHSRTLRILGLPEGPGVVELRSWNRFAALSKELEHTAEDLQLLRLSNGDAMSRVKNGINPVAGLTQAHYIKGFLLLHHLLELVGEVPFLSLMRKYFEEYRGQLVTSHHFLTLFYQHFPNCSSQSLDWLAATWLDSPGLPAGAAALNCLRVSHLPLYTSAVTAHADICRLNGQLQQREGRKRKRAIRRNSQLIDTLPSLASLKRPEQLVLLFSWLLESESLHASVGRRLRRAFAAQLFQHLDVWHAWCELVVQNRFVWLRGDVRQFLVEHQGMGLFLYGELAGSSSPALRALLREVVQEIRKELDLSSLTLINQMLDNSDQ